MTLRHSNMVTQSFNVYHSETAPSSGYFESLPSSGMRGNNDTSGHLSAVSLDQNPDYPSLSTHMSSLVNKRGVSRVRENKTDIKKDDPNSDQESEKIPSGTGEELQKEELPESTTSAGKAGSSPPKSPNITMDQQMTMPEQELVGYHYPMELNSDPDGYHDPVHFHAYNEYGVSQIPPSAELDDSPTIEPPSPQTQYQYQSSDGNTQEQKDLSMMLYHNGPHHNQNSNGQNSGVLVPYPVADSSYGSYQQSLNAAVAPSYYFQQISYNHNNISVDPAAKTHQPQLSVASTASTSSVGNQSSFSHTRTSSSSTVSTTKREDDKSRPQPLIKTAYWDDEKTLCYQVEVNGILISRREDTNFVNGTKLLNVAGLSRGKRDGMLKSERHKDIVKVGSMNLKGVWLPFERACEIARNQGIEDTIYPLLRKDLKEFFATEGLHLKRGEHFKK